MKDVIVVVHATERKYLMDEYEAQLKEQEIPLHVEPVELPDGIGSMTMRWRLEYWQRMCRKFSDYDRIVFTDAWDVLFYGPKEQLFWSIPPILMSAERNCWPDESLAGNALFCGPWRFPNPGMLAGYPLYIERMATYGLMEHGLKIMDQLWCNRNGGFPLDSYTTLFYVASADKEDGSLRTAMGVPFNSRYKTFPQFIHFAGPCHPDRFRAMLRGEVESL